MVRLKCLKFLKPLQKISKFLSLVNETKEAILRYYIFKENHNIDNFIIQRRLSQDAEESEQAWKFYILRVFETC